MFLLRADDKISYFSGLVLEKEIKEQEIIHMVIDKFPVPDDTVSWEEVIDFRDSESIQLYKYGLTNWITDMSYSKLSVKEIEQKLNFLKLSYEDRLKKEKIKYDIGTLELVITTTLGFLENIAKFNFSKAAKLLFNLKRRKSDLIIGETKAPGRAIALLTKLEEKFSKPAASQD